MCNEPNPTDPGVTNDEAGWKKVKAYAEPIIKMLRQMGNENIIIIGSPNWSQRPDFAIKTQLQMTRSCILFISIQVHTR